MYYYEAMAEAAQKTDTDDLYDNIASKLETLCGLSNIMGQNFDRSEPDRLELECNYCLLYTSRLGFLPRLHSMTRCYQLPLKF